MEAQADFDAYTNLLYPSEIMIQGILKYVKDNQVRFIAKGERTIFTGTAPFIFEDRKYLLAEKDAQVIYAEILSMDNSATLAKIASRRPNTLKCLLDEVPEIEKKFKHPILLNMKYDMIAKLIQKALSMILNNVLEKDPNVGEMRTSTNSFAVNIGRTLMDTFMVNKYLYVSISNEEMENEIDIKAKDHIKGYIKSSQDRLQECLNE